MISYTGKFSIYVILELGRIFIFAGQSLYFFFGQRSPLSQLIFAIREVGLRCSLIVSIVGLFTGLVMGLQLYYTLVKFGAQSALGTAVALSLIRELGPVLTALMVVGQAGSTLASELGIQRNDEQIDALSSMGIRPLGYLIGPRLLAGMICFPILTTFFDLIGIFGGYITGSLLLNLDAGVYWHRVYASVQVADVLGGYLKAFVFGFVCMVICLYYGYNTHAKSQLRGVRGVSQTATRAVVCSSICVLAVDYLITSFLI